MDAHLDRLRINARWLAWGLPRRIHASNGKEFRSKALTKARDQSGITITWRLVKTHRYGGHVGYYAHGAACPSRPPLGCWALQCSAITCT